MALNVTLGHATAAGELMPSPFQGEVFVLSRRDMVLDVGDSLRSRPPMRGTLYVTNLRMVLVVDQKYITRAQCESMELPLQGIEEESFNQPIFGTNNLSGRCRPYDDQPFTGEVRFKLKFIEGGAGTFLPIFNAVLTATRRAMRNPQTAPAAPPVPASSLNEQVLSGTLGNSAFIDPNDPSTIYTAQPAVPRQHRAQPSTLRRRL